MPHSRRVLSSCELLWVAKLLLHTLPHQLRNLTLLLQQPQVVVPVNHGESLLVADRQLLAVVALVLVNHGDDLLPVHQVPQLHQQLPHGDHHQVPVVAQVRSLQGKCYVLMFLILYINSW